METEKNTENVWKAEQKNKENVENQAYQISQAKKEQAELYQQGIKSEVLREEPFVTAQDELDYKVYLMIYKWQGKNRGVNVRRIN